MIKDDPVALDRAFENALNAGDLDALTALYMTGSAVEIARRQPAGHWLFVMDMPFGTAAA